MKANKFVRAALVTLLCFAMLCSFAACATNDNKTTGAPTTGGNDVPTTGGNDVPTTGKPDDGNKPNADPILGEWAIAMENFYFGAGKPAESGKTYGYLNKATVPMKFIISAAEGGYYIQDPKGNYLYHTGNASFDWSTTEPAQGGVWELVKNEDGETYKIRNVQTKNYMVYDTAYGNVGCYGEDRLLDGKADIKLVEYVANVEEGKPTDEKVTLESGTYSICKGNVFADAISKSKKNGYLMPSDTAVSFTFTAVEGGYTIQDWHGRYLYHKESTYASFDVSAEVPEAGGHVWTLIKNDNNTYRIKNAKTGSYMVLDGGYGNFGCYTETNIEIADGVVMRNLTITACEPTVDPTSKWTAQEIMDALYALEKGKSLDGTFKLTGKITKVEVSGNQWYTNVKVTIAVEGDKDNREVVCYKLTGEGTAELKEGDVIVVTSGTLTNYKGTYELNGCTLVEVKNPTEGGDNGDQGGTETPVEGNKFGDYNSLKEMIEAAEKLENNGEIKGEYTLIGTVTKINKNYGGKMSGVVVKIGEDEILCYGLTGDKTGDIQVGDTVTITSESLKKYVDKKNNVTIELIDCKLVALTFGPDHVVVEREEFPALTEEGNKLTFNVGGWGTENKWSVGTRYTDVTVKDGLTFHVASTAVGDFAENSGKYYQSKDGKDTWRIYEGESATLTITSDKKIASVTINFTGKDGKLNSAAVVNGTSYESGAAITVNGNTLTLSVDALDSTNEASVQMLITSIVIVYA